MPVCAQGLRPIAAGLFTLGRRFRVLLGIVIFAVGMIDLGTARAQQAPRLDTRLSTDSVFVGERFTVSVVAEHEGDGQLSFPSADAGPIVFGEIEVLGRSAVQHRTGEGLGQVDSVSYQVTTFALDSVRIPAVPVQVVSGGDTTVARAPARTATVISVVGPDAKGIHGVRPPAPFPRPLWTWIVLGLVGAGLVAGLAYLWWRRRQSPEPQPVRPRPDVDQTPYEAATSWIRQLESYDLSDPDAVKPFYVELSHALRVYLVRELDVAALERTTREVVEVLRERPDVPDSATTRVQAVLELADLVKFAEAQPSSEDHEKALQEVRAALDAIETAPPSSPPAVDGVAAASTSPS